MDDDEGCSLFVIRQQTHSEKVCAVGIANELYKGGVSCLFAWWYVKKFGSFL